MRGNTNIRDAVLRSLSAVGAVREARFYADLFAAQDPAKFALIVLDPRCLKNPLLEALISNIRILSDLGLCPTLLVGALDDDRTSVKFQAQRLSKELEQVSVKTAKLNTASYGLIPEVHSHAAAGRMSILELTEAGEQNSLLSVAKAINPGKIIFLQPSGGLSQNGQRIPVLNIETIDHIMTDNVLTTGQRRFIETAQNLSRALDTHPVYVIASPLNLLAELFTTKGSGTLIRQAAAIREHNGLIRVNKTKLKASLEQSFGKSLKPDFFKRDIHKTFLDSHYRGGAILTHLAGIPYLSKFWVTEAARGEGLARDIWDSLCRSEEVFFWRSRRDNPFNSWYMWACDGMQVSGDWRVFWKGLQAPEIPEAVVAASHAPDDFI